MAQSDTIPVFPWKKHTPQKS